jgi:hypothetical protein
MAIKSSGALGVIAVLFAIAAAMSATATAAPKGGVAYAIAPKDGVYQTALGEVTLKKGDKYPAYIFSSRDPVRNAVRRARDVRQQSRQPDTCMIRDSRARSARLHSLAARPNCGGGGYSICSGPNPGAHGRYYLRDGFSSWNRRTCPNTSTSQVIGAIYPGETYGTDNAQWAEFVCLGGWGTAYWYRSGSAGWYNARGICNYNWGSCSYITPPGYQHC